jgi:hypothetical protein
MARTKGAGGAPFRMKNAKGLPFGSYYIRIGKTELCLRTRDPDEAIARARRARLKGERDFKNDSDAQQAAQAVSDAITGTGGAKTPPVVEPPAAPVPSLPPSAPPAAPPAPAALPSGHTPPAALPPLPTPPSSPPPVVPDAVFPPPPGWADGVRAAATEAAAAAPSSDPEGEGGGGDTVDADMLREFIDQAAAIVVEGQIWLQSWLIKRGLKIKTAIVSDSAKGREVGRKIWTRCFSRLVPTDLPIPDYIAAPILVAALTLPLQLGEGAKDISDEDNAKETAPSATVAPAAAA